MHDQPRPVGAPPRGQVTPELLEHVVEQARFFAASARAYDEGFEGEAKRLATVIRVLVHDTRHSTSLLTQFGVKDQMLFADTAVRPPPGGLLLTGALTRLTIGAKTGHEAPLGNLGHGRVHPPLPFADWWEPTVMVIEGVEFSRKRLVLTTANQAGGAHVDPELDADYAALSSGDLFGFIAVGADGQAGPVPGNLALASVRQIAFEVDATLRSELPRVLDLSSVDGFEHP